MTLDEVARACVPPTTALRHIALLVGEGLVERRPDLQDGRRTCVQLTDAGRNKVRDVLAHFSALASEQLQDAGPA